MSKQNLGQAWRAGLVKRAGHILPDTAPETEQDQRVNALKIILLIPGLLEQAEKRGDTFASTHLTLTFGDVSQKHKGNEDDLFKQCVQGRIFASDLAGRAKLVLEWCEQQGLMCFLSAKKVCDVFYYDLMVCPFF